MYASGCIKCSLHCTDKASTIPCITRLWTQTLLRYIHSHHSCNESLQRSLYTLNSLLASYLWDNNLIASWALFQRIHCTRTDLDSYTFTPVLAACSALPNSKRGMQVHALMIKFGSETETVTRTALMDMYSKYGLMEESFRVFAEMGFKDVVTWNALLSNFVRHGKLKKALRVFEDMKRDGVGFTGFTLCSVLKACMHLKAYKQGMQIHGLIVVMGRDLVVLNTALIEFYSNMGLIDTAIKIYRSPKTGRDKVMCNSFVHVCIKNGKYKEAFSILSSIRPNVVALTTALAGCSQNSDLWIGKQVHCIAIRFRFVNETQLCNALIDMYAKCGKISRARLVFDGTLEKDVVSWTSMIDAYGRQGNGLEAVKLFMRMEEEEGDVLPNEVTFLAVLSACSHSGLIEQGRWCFDLIQSKYGLNPGQEHYICYIDILGRAGLIEGVWCLYSDMITNGVKLTSSVWAALLHACVHNDDFRRGEFAAEHLFELDQDEPGIYVLLSNFYAAIGKWKVVDQIRSIMKSKGLFKDPGSSNVAVSSNQ
ncbi:hypothetical protein Ancab_021304 [Ancistrocladus abbreviatus]